MHADADGQAPPRVVASAQAQALIARLRERYGALMFYQSHGCCDGSTPMCLREGEMTLGPGDLQLGEIAGVAFHVSRSQLDYLVGGQLLIDVRPGAQGSFSLEEGEDMHFTAHQRLWTPEEWALLQAHPLP